MSFLSDRKIGMNGEQLLRGLLADASIENVANSELSQAELADWDVQGNLFGLKFSIEIKCDVMEAKTGNVAIEYHNPKQDKSSGINITKADLWVIILEDTSVWIARTTDLKRYVNEEECLRDIQCVGDGNSSIKLFNRDKIFSDIFYRIDDLPTWELSHLLVELLGERHVRVRNKLVADAL